jgi:hypothetical protein
MPAWPTRAIITKKRRVTPQPAVSFAPLAALHLTVPRLGDHSITGTVAGHHPCKGALLARRVIPPTAGHQSSASHDQSNPHCRPAAARKHRADPHHHRLGARKKSGMLLTRAAPRATVH